ncbi:hypothetical protein E2320_022117, partial [Naja naja]
MTGLPLSLLLFWLLPPITAKRMQTVRGCIVLSTLFQIQKSYYRPGHLNIGGNLPLATVIVPNTPHFQKSPTFFDLTMLGVGFEFTQGDRTVHSSFFRINPKEFPQYVGLIQLLLYFQWNWVGLVAPENDNGEHFISSLIPMLKEKEICLAFTEMMRSDFLDTPLLKSNPIFKTWSMSEVIILFGDSGSVANIQIFAFAHEQFFKTSFQKVWILTSHWKVRVMGSQDVMRVLKPFHGALHFRDHTGDLSKFRDFLMLLDPFNAQGDVFLLL